METGERLAAYVAGELDADETRALEAELARDPAMRARVEAIRETDTLLADLPTVEPRSDFSARLRDAVASELDTTLTDDGGDELAARRRAKADGIPGWQKLAVAAAVLAIGGVGLAQLLPMGGDDAGELADEGAAMEAMAAPEPESGPTVVSAGRSFDADDLKSLAEDGRFDEVLAQRLDEQEAPSIAAQHEEAMTGDGATGGDAGIAAESGPAQDEQAESSAETALAPPADSARDFGLRTVGDITEAELEDVRRCLPQLLDAAPVIPVYAELITFDGTEAIVYGLVGNDPEQDSYRRVELWVVDRADCQVVHFEQVDR